MSGRNRSGDHISKDKFSVKDTREDDIAKDRNKKAPGKAAKKEAAHGLRYGCCCAPSSWPGYGA